MRFRVRLTFIKLCTHTLLFLNNLDMNIRLFRKFYDYIIYCGKNSYKYQNPLPFRCFILVEMQILSTQFHMASFVCVGGGGGGWEGGKLNIYHNL